MAASEIKRYLMSFSIRSETGATPATHCPAITLSRTLGVPARKIAELVARELNFQVFDREILITIAEDTQLGEVLINSLDEGKRSALDSWIRGWVSFDQRIIDPTSFHHIAIRVVRGISLHGSAIIIGRGANFILRNTDAFRVRLTAPLEMRIGAVASGAATGRPMSPREAQTEIEKHAKQRRSFIHSHFRADIDDPKAYDAMFNLRRLDPEHAAGLIIDAYRRTVGEVSAN